MSNGLVRVDVEPVSADAELVNAMTRIAEGLDHLLVGIGAAVALLALIAVCEVIRLGVFT
jgi:hypothetical protein